jgi:predicted RNase H-like nuclease (RuvC/YqgF family)
MTYAQRNNMSQIEAYRTRLSQWEARVEDYNNAVKMLSNEADELYRELTALRADRARIAEEMVPEPGKHIAVLG